MAIVECVPNFSEGRDRALIDQIATTISGVDGCELLDVDPGADTNRTVVTFVGDPDAVVEGAFQAIAKAAELIDMRRHQGAHARMGATDVCPFVPVRDITMDECAELARRLGARVGEELGISVYLYEAAASAEERQNLAKVRAGEYEGMAAKLKQPEWKPDFGPTDLHETAGVTAIGAREFLLAYNVNLNTRDRKLAHDIALDVREAGRAKRDSDGEIVRDEAGKAIKVPGRLKAVKGVGWYIDEYRRAQISMNLVNYNVTSLHHVFDVIGQEADLRGLRVTGSELVGLTPLAPILAAGQHYLRKQGKSTGVPEADVIECAIQSLGLREISDFDPHEKIIEYRLRQGQSGLADMTLRAFGDELSSESPAPGGGSVAALCGSLAAGLAGMVANLTHRRKGSEDHWEEMERLAVEAQGHKDWLMNAVDADTEAFNAVLAARRLPRKSEEQKAARSEAMKQANRGATLVPVHVLERTLPVFELAQAAAERGNPNSLSDAGVAGLCALTAAEGAWYNVLINLDGLTDDATWASETRERADQALKTARDRARGLASLVEERLGG